MAPIPTRIRFLQVLLIVLATAFTLIGFLFPHQDLNLYPAVWGYLSDGENQYPLILGIISVTRLAAFLGFIFIYLAFEFYGLKTALSSVLALALLMALCYGGILGLNEIAERQAHRAFFDRRLLMFFTTTRREFMAGGLGYFGGLSLLFLMAALVKKATSNYFMFFRFVLASLIGFTAFVAIETFLNFSPEYGTQDLLIFAATPAAQFALLTLLAVVPLYILRLLFSLFKGRADTEKENVAEGKKGAVETVFSWFGKFFGWFVFFPGFFGALSGGLVFAASHVYLLGAKHGLIKEAPEIFPRLAADPLHSAQQLGVLAALAVLAFNALFRALPVIVKAFLAWRRGRKQVPAAAPAPAVEEDTVSEKVNPLGRTA